MCGIAGFLSNSAWKISDGQAAFDDVARELALQAAGEPDWDKVKASVETLEARFDQLQSFVLFEHVVSNKEATSALKGLAATLYDLQSKASELAANKGSSVRLMSVAEKLQDYAWQIQEEVLGKITETARLTPQPPQSLSRSALFLGWSIDRVVSSIDRLEVRGRDSLGLAIVMTLADKPDLSDDLKDELERRCGFDETMSGRMTIEYDVGDATVVRTVYKVANLIGRLGDNSENIRSELRQDRLLWMLADRIDDVNIFAHTRWASNGIINVPNCHPVDGTVLGEQKSEAPDHGSDIMFALNGDVDNYSNLVKNAVSERNFRINPSVTTDAKILPVLYCLTNREEDSGFDRFMDSLRACRGSMAVIMQDIRQPDSLYIGQKGSGQALYACKTADGWAIASEVYGLAAVCRNFVSMNVGGQGGVALRLISDHGVLSQEGRHLTGSEVWSPSPEPAQVFARDINRGNFEYYIEKELSEAPESFRRTLHGKYQKEGQQINWLIKGIGRGEEFQKRLHHGGSRPIRRVVCIGQGTAAIAAMGIAYLIQRALRRGRIKVEALKASEFSGFVGDDSLDDTIVIAVSQSGTTTDTNRIVDIVRDRGAWVHAIVNRRNSSLVQKAHSHTYTSTGRDVEMSVASTKAFYSQVAAGKLLALWLADEFGIASTQETYNEICELETLHEKLRVVLSRNEAISAVANETATATRNWAIVGNGANRIAAEEIRIKLSELCYKAIPCDVTEDKKHIDLSTEPLTLVVANDLPENVVQDTVKEVAIFHAHNGQPIVFCQQGESRFDKIAKHVIPLPNIGGGLGFVLATMAGHLFGVAAAKAIDQTAVPFRDIRAFLSTVAENYECWNSSTLSGKLGTAADCLFSGKADTALSASMVAQFYRYLNLFLPQPDHLDIKDARLDELTEVTNRIIEELTRPIDTIRHQAKTVTVGISRPTDEVTPIIIACLTKIGCSIKQIAADDVRLLEALSPIVTDVTGALLYTILPSANNNQEGERIWLLEAIAGYRASSVEDSRYATPTLAHGSKRAVLRKGRMVCRLANDEAYNGGQIILPVFGEDGDWIQKIALLHLTVASEGSSQLKRSILKKFDDRYEDLRDYLAENENLPSIDDLLLRIPFPYLVFATNDQVIHWVHSSPEFKENDK